MSGQAIYQLNDGQLYPRGARAIRCVIRREVYNDLTIVGHAQLTANDPDVHATVYVYYDDGSGYRSLATVWEGKLAGAPSYCGSAGGGKYHCKHRWTVDIPIPYDPDNLTSIREVYVGFQGTPTWDPLSPPPVPGDIQFEAWGGDSLQVIGWRMTP
jgi:hypothetical protein